MKAVEGRLLSSRPGHAVRIKSHACRILQVLSNRISQKCLPLDFDRNVSPKIMGFRKKTHLVAAGFWVSCCYGLRLVVLVTLVRQS